MSSGFADKLGAVMRYATGQFGKDLRQRAEREPITAVLCYHRVTISRPKDFSEIEAGVPHDLFERQMRFLLKTFRPVAAADVLDDQSPGLRFAISFDDGTMDGIEVAAPILEKLGIPGTFYAVEGFVGTDRTFWWEELAGFFRQTRRPSADLAAIAAAVTGASAHRPEAYPLGSIRERLAAHKDISRVIRQGDPAYVDDIMDALSAELGVPRTIEGRDYPLMGWEELKALTARGHAIGGHTATHGNLALLDKSLLHTEVVGSTLVIEDRLQAPVESFAYPYGMIRTPTEDVGGMLRTCPNVRLAFGTGPGMVAGERQDRWALPRCGLTRQHDFIWAYNLTRAAGETAELSAA